MTFHSNSQKNSNKRSQKKIRVHTERERQTMKCVLLVLCRGGKRYDVMNHDEHCLVAILTTHMHNAG